jgi:hypothetical protein
MNKTMCATGEAETVYRSESLVSHQIYSGNLIVHFAQVHVYTVLVSCCIAGKRNYVYFVFTPI